MRRRSYLAATSAALAGLAGCASSAGGGGPYGGWMDGVGNFDGSTVDRSDADSVTVDVGAPGNGRALAFAPPAVRVSAGTTVVWQWTGEGGSHNVVATDGSFESEYHVEAGATFEHTFDAPGTYKYYCLPHRPNGMKGVVVAE